MKNKSGAARRLVSLMLALGLIFTLAPASVFAGNEGHDAYFYLKRYDAQAGGDLAKTDYYYIGKGKVDLDEPSQGEEYTANVQQRILRAPQDPIILDATNRDLTTYTYSDNGAEGTYSIRSWDVIKGESGATTAYPDNEPLVEGKATWHVDGTVELHMPAAYFYGLKPGANEGSEDPDDYYYIGSGKVALKSAETGKSVALTDENRGRVVAQAPTSFPAIEYNGVTYNYDTGGAAGTYSIEDWYTVVAASGAVDGNGQQIPEAANKTTWHVNGKIVLHGPVDVPDKPDPVADVEGVYNGEPYTLTAPDVEGFSLKYQIQDPASGTWTDSVIPPSRTSADVTNVKVIYTYNKPSGDKNDYNDIVYEAKIDVQKRPLTLTVDDQEKFEGEQDPSFTYKITSTGENEGLVNGHQLSNVMLSKEQNSTTGEWEIKILSWEITEKVGDDEHDRKNNYDVTVIPGTLTVKQNELPQEWRPTVKSTIAIYDGTPHNLQIEYKSEAPARYFDVKYEVLVQENGVGSWKELAPYTVAEQTDVGALQVRVTSPSKGRLLMPPMLWSRI